MVTPPAVRPAAAIAALAFAVVMPDTSGTVTMTMGWGPREIVRFTAVPVATDAPAAGDELITLPDAMVLLYAWVMVPVVRPADVRALPAAAWDIPMTLGTDTIWGPMETLNETAVPCATDAPAAGVVLITSPAGTVVLLVFVTPPAVRPAAVTAVLAFAVVMPDTSGTVIMTTGWGPWDIVRFTAVPVATAAPAAGDELITLPDAMVLLYAWVMAPVVRPADVRALPAAAWDIPTTLGTYVIWGPMETLNETAVPCATDAPAAGVVLITSPAGTVVLLVFVTPPAVRPAAAIAALAFAVVMPDTSGTVTIGIGWGPWEIARFTAVPCSTAAPAAGDELITLPEATVLLYAWVMVPVVRPADFRALLAAAWVIPMTLGTDTIWGPMETLNETAVPCATDAPAAGDVLTTSPAGTVVLLIFVTPPVFRPVAMTAALAFAVVIPDTSGTVTMTIGWVLGILSGSPQYPLPPMPLQQVTS